MNVAKIFLLINMKLQIMNTLNYRERYP